MYTIDFYIFAGIIIGAGLATIWWFFVWVICAFYGDYLSGSIKYDDIMKKIR